MNRDKSVEAIFGTWLATTVSGDGAVLLDPTNRLCAYGATVRLVAVPGASSFFSGWTVTSGNGTATPSANPLTYSVVDPTPAFEAAFDPLDAGQATLTVIPEGRGEVVISPQANRYNLGDTVRLVAVPDAGQRFRRWTGDESSGSLSLDVLVGRSKVITAVFSKRPGLAALPFGNRPAGEDLRLHLTGEPGIDYQIMASDDLRTWTEVAVTSTPYGTAQVSDPLSGGFLHRFYRAVSPPGYTSPPPVSLVSTGSVWRYLDNGSDQGTNWVGHDFDDSTWASGPAQLGYGDDDEATVVSFGGDELNKYVTTYFRHSFDVNDAAIFWGLTVRLLRDDGGVVYLNGVEVFRSNMPAGAIVFSTFATLGVAGSVENTFFESPVDPNLLINGTNVLAVEIHQVSPASSDVSFDLELIGQLE